jgi:hypothetical protein
MNRPEDDPVIVALIASNLLGHHCQDWPAALVEARRGLKLSRQLIDDETFQASVKCDDREFYVRDGLRDWIGERAFIERLTNGLVRTKRIDRKKAFVAKYWGKMSPQAPSIEDPHSWTLHTLREWQHRFTMTCWAERVEANYENGQKGGRPRIRAKKNA